LENKTNNFQYYCLFFLSGASALIYEIAWLNRIQLIMGYTIYALATVLASYLLGLAWGSFSSAKLLEQKVSGLNYYLFFELAIAIYALVFYPLLSLTHSLYSPLATYFNWSIYSLSLIQFIFCGVLIFIPTFLMGATLPLLADHLFKKDKGLADNISGLYSANTFGAFAGCLFGGFILLPTIGYEKTIYFAALINLSLFLIAILSEEKKIVNDLPSLKLILSSIIPDKNSFNFEKQHRGLLFILFVSGFISVGSQILWNRLAQLIFGASAYIFPMITGVVLLGITIGAILVQKYFHGREAKEKVLGFSLFLGSLFFAGGNYLYSNMPLVVSRFLQSVAPGHIEYVLFQLTFTSLCLLPSIIALGILFPTCMSLYIDQSEKEHSSVGTSYSVNILGVIASSVICSFVILPQFGIQNLESVLLVLLSLAFLVFVIKIKKVEMGFFIIPIFLFVLVKVLPAFDKSLLTEGYFYNRGEKFSNTRFLDYSSVHNWQHSKLIDYKDDAHGTISIHQSQNASKDDSYWFKINGKVDGNSRGDKSTVQLLALLPLLISTDYESVLTVGLGTGETANMTGSFPKMKESVVLELSPSMIEFSEKYFYNQSFYIWNDERFKVLNRDGREFLLHNEKKFDLIISEPSNPWVDGIGSLFTIEYFNLVLNSLSKNGVGVIWFHSYGLSCDALYSVFKSAHLAFPSLRVFKRSSDLFIVFSKKKELHFKKIDDKYNFLKEEFNRIVYKEKIIGDFESALKGLTWFENRAQLETVSRQNVFNNDDNQYLQFSAGKSYYQNLNCN
tara:strand:- start:41487 stop:43850 length:2364 start_codon:yes stop_codon:yes gene_type:complete